MRMEPKRKSWAQASMFRSNGGVPWLGIKLYGHAWLRKSLQIHLSQAERRHKLSLSWTFNILSFRLLQGSCFGCTLCQDSCSVHFSRIWNRVARFKSTIIQEWLLSSITLRPLILPHITLSNPYHVLLFPDSLILSPNYPGGVTPQTITIG